MSSSRGRIVIFGWADSAHIARWAKGVISRGFQVQVISSGGESIPGVETIVFPRKGRFAYLSHAGRVARAANQFKPDLVHCHYASGFGLWTIASGFHPTLVSVWGSDVIGVAGLTKLLVRRTLHRADWVSATGEFLKKATIDLLPETADKMTVIPFGITIPQHPASMPELPVQLLFLKEHRRIYGPDILIEAFAFAHKQVGSIRLTMAASGDMTELLKARIRELDLEDAVDFPGYIDHNQIESAIAKHHILVMPSRMESFGVAALEAAGCARPVIATRVGGIPEVVHDGETGILVPPENAQALAEAIVLLANDSDLRTKFGLAGYRFVQERYQWDKCLDKMCELYDRLIADGKKHSVL